MDWAFFIILFSNQNGFFIALGMSQHKIPKWKQTLFLYLFAFTKVPMIFFARPKIVNIDDDESRVLIPYKRRNRNHVRSIYMGSLAIGADLCIGFLAMHHIQQINPKIIPIFKDFKINFLKLALGPTEFVCDQGDLAKKMVLAAHESKERQTLTFKGKAFSQVKGERVLVADFELTLSIKAKS